MMGVLIRREAHDVDIDIRHFSDVPQASNAHRQGHVGPPILSHADKIEFSVEIYGIFGEQF